MSNNNITDEFREKWISKIYTTHFETMPEAVRWIRENITDDMEASIHLYKLATENLKEEIETLKAENSKMRKALDEVIAYRFDPDKVTRISNEALKKDSI